MSKASPVGLNDLYDSIKGTKGTDAAIADEPTFSGINMPTPQKQEFIIFRLKDHYEGSVYVPGEDIVANKDGVLEKVRLINGVPTIWSTEQDKNPSLTPAYIRKNIRSLEFQGGVLRINVNDVTALEFARITRCNMESKTFNKATKMLFYEYDPKRQAQALLQKEDFELEMVGKAKDTPADYMKKHAAYLGIVFVDTLGLPKTDDMIRRDYMRAAKHDPIRFNNSYSNPVVEISYMVKRAMLDSKIDTNIIQGTAHYAEGGGFICGIPTGKNAVDALVEFALLPTSESKEFVERLKKITKK